MGEVARNSRKCILLDAPPKLAKSCEVEIGGCLQQIGMMTGRTQFEHAQQVSSFKGQSHYSRSAIAFTETLGFRATPGGSFMHRPIVNCRFEFRPPMRHMEGLRSHFSLIFIYLGEECIVLGVDPPEGGIPGGFDDVFQVSARRRSYNFETRRWYYETFDNKGLTAQ